MPRKRGYRHIDRLINVIFDVAEDPDQTPELRLDAAKTLLAALERRTPNRKRKSPETRAVELMLGAPKKKTPFTDPTTNPMTRKPLATTPADE